MNRREIEINSAIRLVVLLLGVVTAGFVLWACINIEMLFAAVGLLAMLVVLAPFVQLKRYDLFSPWSFVILAIGLLCAPQAVCMSFNFPDEESIERMMFLGREPSFFLYPSGVFLLALICLTTGYFGIPSKNDSPIVIHRDYKPQNMWFVLAATLMIAVVSILAFIRLTGGTESGRISDKRTNIQTLDVKGDDGTRQYGHLRQLSKLASAVFLILYSYFLVRYDRLTTFQTSLLLFVFLAACALPFYASSRQQVCWVILNGLGVNYYLGRGGFWLKCGIVAMLGLTVFIAMSMLRNQDTDSAVESASVTRAFEKLILNRNGPGISKTAHIINGIPGKLEYKYGATFAEWLIAPIPRDLYPNKPMIGTGPEIGTKIYGTKFSGVPPGYIAELYWNFHLPGVIFGMFFLGLALQRLYSIFSRIQMSPDIKVPIYLFAVMPIAFTVLGNSLGYGTMMRFVDFVTIASVVFFCTHSYQQGEA